MVRKRLEPKIGALEPQHAQSQNGYGFFVILYVYNICICIFI